MFGISHDVGFSVIFFIALRNCKFTPLCGYVFLWLRNCFVSQKVDEVGKLRKGREVSQSVCLLHTCLHNDVLYTRR